MSSCGPDESVGGDIKFLRLKQREIGGLVTDGSVRDTDEIINYGFPVSTLYIYIDIDIDNDRCIFALHGSENNIFDSTDSLVVN
jgi:hypothetical protein